MTDIDPRKYDDGAQWLQSDAQILGRTVQSLDPKGIKLTIQMPEGGPIEAVVAKMDAGSVNQFTAFVRGEYHERKAEQMAQKKRRAILRDTTGEEPRGRLERKKNVPVPEGSMEKPLFSREDVVQRAGELATKRGQLKADLIMVEHELDITNKILAVFEDSELPAPDSDAEGSGVDHNDQPAVPVRSEAEFKEPVSDEGLEAGDEDSNHRDSEDDEDNLILPATVPD